MPGSSTRPLQRQSTSSASLGGSSAGPPKRRKCLLCTDFPCLLLFLAALGALGWVAYKSTLPPSDLRRVLFGLDSSHDLCGVDNTLAPGESPFTTVTINRPSVWLWLWPFRAAHEQPREVTVQRGGRNHVDRPLLYFTFPTNRIADFPVQAVCVSECPSPPLTTPALDDDPSQYVCTGSYYGTPTDRCDSGGDCGSGSFNAPTPDLLFSRLANASQCADPSGVCEACFPQYRTVRVLNYCLPDPQHAFKTFMSVVSGVASLSATMEGSMTIAELDEMRSLVSSLPHLVYEDLQVAAPVIYTCVGGAFLFGLLWLLLLRLFAHAMVWLTVVGIGTGCGVGAYFMWQTQANMKASERYDCCNHTSPDPLFSQQADALHYAFYAVAVVGVVYALVVLCLYRKIFIAVKVMKEASRAVSALPSTLLLPVVTLMLSAAILFLCALVCLLLISTGELLVVSPGFGHLHVPLATWGYVALVCFAGVWFLCFVRHLQHCAISGTVSTWYFSGNQWLDMGSFTCLGALGRALRHHIGSIAFGSLLITILQAFRLLVIVIMKRLKACAGDSHLARLTCCCVACCLGCVERCVRFLSRSAYVVMMVRGSNFCASAQEAFSLLTKHMVKVAVLRSVGWAFLLLGKVFISAGAAATGAFLLLTQEPYTTELFSIVPAVVTIAIGAWVVGTGFMSVYNMAIETVFLCYTMDREPSRSGQESVAKLCDEAEAEEMRAAREGGGWFVGRRPVVELSVVADTELKAEDGAMTSTRPAAVEMASVSGTERSVSRKASFGRGARAGAGGRAVAEDRV